MGCGLNQSPYSQHTNILRGVKDNVSNKLTHWTKPVYLYYLYRLRLVYCQYHPTASMLYTDRLTTNTVIRLSVDISRKTPMLHMRYHSQWVTLTFDLACRWAFRWAEVRSKSRLKSQSKVKVNSLSKRLRPNLRCKYRLRPKLSWTWVYVRTLPFSLRFRSVNRWAKG